MKILFLTNNSVSGAIIRWLRDIGGEDVVVIESAVSKGDVRRHDPDFMISYNYRYIIGNDVLSLLPDRVINLHISMLPWNRGADPNAWSFLDDTPKGVTIHMVDNGVDTGNILLQEEVFMSEEETLASSYDILNERLRIMFMQNWDKIKNFAVVPRPQASGGSMHHKDDMKEVRKVLEEKKWNIKISEFKRMARSCK